MNEENQVYFVDSDQLPPAALERKHRLEQAQAYAEAEGYFCKQEIWHIKSAK